MSKKKAPRVRTVTLAATDEPERVSILDNLEQRRQNLLDELRRVNKAIDLLQMEPSLERRMTEIKELTHWL